VHVRSARAWAAEMSAPVFIRLAEREHDVIELVQDMCCGRVHQAQCARVVRFRKSVLFGESGPPHHHPLATFSPIYSPVETASVDAHDNERPGKERIGQLKVPHVRKSRVGHHGGGEGEGGGGADLRLSVTRRRA
jgi:hypothetical protein